QLGEDLAANPVGPHPGDEDGLRYVLTEMAKVFENDKSSPADWQSASVTAASALEALVRLRTHPDRPRLPLLQRLTDRCRKAFRDRPELRPAAAHVLGQAHRAAHAVFLPDTNAKDTAVAAYRQEHPAAAAASQTLVIYPTNRLVAPGP